MVAVRPATIRAGQRVMVNVDSSPARWTGALIMVGAVGWLIVLLAHGHDISGEHILDRLAWPLSLLVAVMVLAHGSLLGRPVTVGHASVAGVIFSAGTCAHLLGLELFGGGLVAGAGLVLMWPMPSRPDPAALPRVWALIEATHGDPLSPFAMQMVAHCRQRGAQRLSLAFAAFPQLFDNTNRNLVQSAYYIRTFLGRWLIELESLYRYLRKFHSFAQRRYVLVPMRHLPGALAVLLALEFMPRRRRLSRAGSAGPWQPEIVCR